MTSSPLDGVRYNTEKGEYDFTKFVPSATDQPISDFVSEYIAMADPERRSLSNSLTAEDFDTLVSFARRRVVLALRGSDTSFAVEGLLALTPIDRDPFDYRRPAVGRPAAGSVRRMRGRRQARETRLGHQVAIGTYATRNEALDAVARARVDAKRGMWVSPAGSRMRVATVAESWWATRSGHRPSTRQRDRMVLDHDILPALGQAQLVELTHDQVQAWVNSLAARLAPTGVRRSFTVLSQLLEGAVDAGLLATNPATRVRLPRGGQYEARFLTPTELELLADLIDPRYRSMVLVMAWATLRIGEAVGLRRKDLDLKLGRITVADNVAKVAGRIHERPTKTKAGRRTISLPPSIVNELRTHVLRFASVDYVFPRADGLASPAGRSVAPDRVAASGRRGRPRAPSSARLETHQRGLLGGCRSGPFRDRPPSGSHECGLYLRPLRPPLPGD